MVALPDTASLPTPFASRVGVAGMVDQVIGDLEGEADVAGIAAIRRARVRGQPGHDAGGLDRELDQCAGL